MRSRKSWRGSRGATRRCISPADRPPSSRGGERARSTSIFGSSPSPTSCCVDGRRARRPAGGAQAFDDIETRTLSAPPAMKASSRAEPPTTRLQAHAAARVVAELVAARNRGELHAASVREAAQRLGVGEHTAWRWIAAEGPPQRRRPSPRRVELDDELCDAVSAAGRQRRGGVARAARPGSRGGAVAYAAGGVRTRAAASRACVGQHGEAGRREHGLYLRYEAPHRNAVWQADHKQLPVLVQPRPRCSPRCATPSSCTTAVERSAASRNDFAGTTAWSSPPAVGHAALSLGIEPNPAAPYAPHEKQGRAASSRRCPVTPAGRATSAAARGRR